MKKNKILNIAIHLIAWAGIVSLPLLILPKNVGHHNFNPKIIHPMNFFRLIGAFLPLTIVYYLNYFVLVPKFFLKNEKTKFFLSIIILYFLYLAVPFTIIYLNQGVVPLNGGFILINTLVFLIAMLITIGIKLNESRKKLEEINIKIEKEKINAQLLYLKAQVNPHFLFNTLNSIYGMIISKSDKSADAILSLSKMMRFVLNEAQDEKVKLSSKLNYIKTYINLQNCRISSSVNVICEIEEVENEYTIAPLLLITFIENAFKHGVSTNEESYIDIKIFVEKDNLNLLVKNKKLKNVNSFDDHSGIGIENTLQRLKLLYPDKHTLVILDSENEYFVNLKLNLL